MTHDSSAGTDKIMEMTRIISMVALLLHLYAACYGLFFAWHLTSPITDRLLDHLAGSGIAAPGMPAKLLALGALLLSLVGTDGTKSADMTFRGPAFTLTGGLCLYFGGYLVFAPIVHLPATVQGVSYLVITFAGYLLVLRGGALLSRVWRVRFLEEVSNKHNEAFPQEERCMETPYSVHFPMQYSFRGKQRNGWINVINVFRGLLISGLPGSGKTLLVKRLIAQQMQKQFSLLVYDFKYPDLTLATYNHYLRERSSYPVTPEFRILNFEEPYHRSNPLTPASLRDVTDAGEAARTILLGLNHEWISRQGDFWIESPITFLTALIWYLRSYQDGRFCTLPHVIELIQAPYKQLFTLLRSNRETAVLIQPFLNAYRYGARQQLEGQISGATISLGRLAAPNLYYVLSGDDFTMDIGNAAAPCILCLASKPSKAHIYGSVASLYLSAFQRVALLGPQRPVGLVLDEFPTLYFNGIDHFLAVCRSYRVAVTLVIQDASQLRAYYGHRQAEVILNLIGNIISGQVTGESAQLLSERLGKIIQPRNTLSISDHPSLSVHGQLDYAVPRATIAALSTGEVVGMVADDPEMPLPRKLFHAKIKHDLKAIRREESGFRPLPSQKADESAILQNYHQIKADIERLVADETALLGSDPLVGDPPDSDPPRGHTPGHAW